MTHDAVAGSEQAEDTDEDATIVVDRRALHGPDDQTDTVERARVPEASEPESDAVEHDTVVVDRTGASTTAEHDTVVVDRTGTATVDSDRTVALQRSDASTSGKTVAVGRTPSSPSARAPRGGRLVVRGRIPAARAVRPEPIDPALLRPARLAPGPGVLDRYGVRPAPEPVASPTAAGQTPGIPRADSTGLVSVARHSRRLAGVGLAAVAAACAVSIAGLAWIIVALLSA